MNRFIREADAPEWEGGAYTPKKGGMRKIASFPIEKTCHSPEHNPPMNMVMEPGIYEYECPSCGHKETIIVEPKATL